MRKIIKKSVLGIVTGWLLGFSIGNLGSRYFSSYDQQQEQTAENDKIMNSMMQDTDIDISSSAENTINHISRISIDNAAMEKLEITEIQLVNAYKLYKQGHDEHLYQSLYDKNSDSIKWDQAIKKVYENSKRVAEAEKANSLKLEAFSEEEIKLLLERIKTTYEQLVNDFPNYDKKELACKLEYYVLLKSNKDNCTITATINNDKIVFYSGYSELSEIFQKDTVYHESFHLAATNCLDNREDDKLASIMPVFIEENYASLYAKDLTSSYQTCYTNYNNALNVLQLSLALSENYQLDDLLTDTIYNDPISFMQEFPVYGNNKKQFFLDTLEALRGLNILVNSSSANNYYPDSTYTKEILNQIEQSTFKQLSKIFYSNLIVLNEKHPEMSLKDNAAFIHLFLKTWLSIPIDVEDVVNEEKNLTIYSKKFQYPSELNLEEDNLPIKIRQKSASNYFIDYISEKYNKEKEEVSIQLFNVDELDKNYSFPEFLETEKKDFYKDLTKKTQSRQLVKKK